MESHFRDRQAEAQSGLFLSRVIGWVSGQTKTHAQTRDCVLQWDARPLLSSAISHLNQSRFSRGPVGIQASSRSSQKELKSWAYASFPRSRWEPCLSEGVSSQEPLGPGQETSGQQPDANPQILWTKPWVYGKDPSQTSLAQILSAFSCSDTPGSLPHWSLVSTFSVTNRCLPSIYCMSNIVLLAGAASVIKYSSFHGVYTWWERQIYTHTTTIQYL